MAPGQIDEPQDQQITVGGEAYTLRFSVRAWASLVKLWGLKSVQEAQKRLNAIGDATQIEPIVDILWASLQRHHPTIDHTKAADIADDMGIERLADILPKLIRGSNPGPSDGDGKKKTAPKTRR